MRYTDFSESERKSIRINSGDILAECPEHLLAQMDFTYQGENSEGKAIYWANYPEFVEQQLLELGL